MPSVRDTACPNAPFGRDCAQILEQIATLYASNDLSTELNRPGGYLLSRYGSGKTIGLFSHADVVAVHQDWLHTAPFEPLEKDGYLIGRGTLDDKSAIVISLYCVKIIRELGIPFHSELVMFTGSNEETGMADMDSYLESHTPPTFSLISDTAFPLYRGDKCGMNFHVLFRTSLKDIQSFSGGTAMNITLGEATATVHGEVFQESGISRHSALPEGSVNAGFLLAQKLLACDSICESDKKQMQLLAHILENYYGEVFGIEHADECGKLTCTNCMITCEGGKLNLGFNMRFGLSADTDRIRRAIRTFFAQYDCDVEFEPEKRGYLTPVEDPFIQACLTAYRDFTGVFHPQVHINAGGTYGRKLPRSAEIGTTLKWGIPEGTPAGHGGAHQPDECIHMDGFLEALELTVQMVLACDRVEE